MKLHLDDIIKEKIDRAVNHIIIETSEKYNYEISELYEKFGPDIKKIHDAIKSCDFSIKIKR